MKDREQKRTEGQVRNEAWQKLTPKQQLADLDRRLGVGIGATRQRKKLAKLLEAPPAPVVEVKPATISPAKPAQAASNAEARRRKMQRQYRKAA